MVGEESARGPSIMVGDGINDAPALAAASVGVALAARGATASSEAADVVLTVDRIDRLGEAVRIAGSAQRIAGSAQRTATQSATVGMGLCLVAMIAAAFGLLAPAVGAVVQEGIDVIAIAWALRVGLMRPHGAQRIPAQEAELLRRLAQDHRETLSLVEQVRETADALEDQGSIEPARRLLVTLDTTPRSLASPVTPALLGR